MVKKQEKWDTLDGLLEGIWKMLDRGVSNYRDPCHWPVLGTAGPKGPELRCVILRGFSRSDRILLCHTDARAAKVREIARCSKVSWLFYHLKKKVQLRITGHATLHAEDDFADRQWAASRLASRLNYCATKPPGTPVDNPLSGWPNFLFHKAPTLLVTEKGRQHFAVISCRFDAIDWLVLRLSGNRRARFKWDEAGLHAEWLVP